MFKLVALDMDGTLLNKDHEISQRSAEVLRKLAESGVIVFIATGRSSGSVTKYVTGALKDIPQAIFPMVCFNGSCCLIRDQSNGEMKTLFKNDLSEEAVHEPDVDVGPSADTHAGQYHSRCARSSGRAVAARAAFAGPQF